MKAHQINCLVNEALRLSVRQQQDKLSPHTALPAHCDLELIDTCTASSEEFKEGAQLPPLRHLVISLGPISAHQDRKFEQRAAGTETHHSSCT